MDINILKNIVEKSKSFREVSDRINNINIKIQRKHLKQILDDNKITYSHFIFYIKYNNLIGKKSGKLTVQSVSSKKDNKNHTRYYLKCLCECGKFKTIRADMIESYISCGCHSHNRWNMVSGNNPAFSGVGCISSTYFNELKRSAKRRNLKFLLTKEQLWNLFLKQEQKCAMTNLPLTFGRVRKYHGTTASLDRIDNNLGYTIDNVRFVLKDINMIKNKYDNEYFILLCNLVAKYNHRDI